ncbi:Flavin-containing monooxygenase family protein [Penicillium ucsense]|uniref:Flavin-containing monooxygenase family protein n=1 Tax=Penicillium ucsense TaxID=2839758 RepID=A0A8J8W2I9_9EURO|nr:Flavin-containing monooxygenase family protein [Penicillium ucsense]KAF7735566.1 Flavin-containing monooxygenase family protein [Penicillium ucsense]
MRTKKVAIIGAGPSGLVTAKTLLHNSSGQKYVPIIFDARDNVGGLWAQAVSSSSCSSLDSETGDDRDHNVDADADAEPRVTLNPSMRTNLSRFSVAFSDLSWETALGCADPPMFPRARQVGRYLEAYAERYVPGGCMRLRSRVVQTERVQGRDGACSWKVYWVEDLCRKQDTTQPSCSVSHDVKVEDYDLLVIASGYFARPWIPDLPGLSKFTGKVIHSSALGKQSESAAAGQSETLVVGGSMSGVEAASTLALRRSSLSSSIAPSTLQHKKTTITHVHSRPIWCLPLYLPQDHPSGTSSFLPLDLAMYDLSRRPPGPVEYAIGSLSAEKMAKTKAYFNALLGSDYERYGHSHSQQEDGDESSTQKNRSQPEWVAISNDYAEFVRSGDIKPITGRVLSVDPTDSATDKASVTIQTVHGIQTLENVTTIIMATGFSPFDSLSFLPEEVLAGLEIDHRDPCIPVILDQGSTIRSELPDLGFVGFYRGPYWGVMEMQARYLGRVWATGNKTLGEMGSRMQTLDQRKTLRSLRNPSNNEVLRAQFPMGDYVGLMEHFARELEMERKSLSPSDNDGSGPVVPARYTVGERNDETKRTLDDLCAILQQNHPATGAATSLAVFRALQGEWEIVSSPDAGPIDSEEDTTRPGEQAQKTEEVGMTDMIVFVPRHPLDPSHDREYILQRQNPRPIGTLPTTMQDPTPDPLSHGTILRLSESGAASHASQIEILHESRCGPSQLNQHHAWRLELSRLSPGEKDGESVIHGQTVPLRENDDRIAVKTHGDYTFYFCGVSIVKWESRAKQSGTGGALWNWSELGLGVTGGRKLIHDVGKMLTISIPIDEGHFPQWHSS